MPDGTTADRMDPLAPASLSRGTIPHRLSSVGNSSYPQATSSPKLCHRQQQDIPSSHRAQTAPAHHPPRPRSFSAHRDPESPPCTSPRPSKVKKRPFRLHPTAPSTASGTVAPLRSLPRLPRDSAPLSSQHAISTIAKKSRRRMSPHQDDLREESIHTRAFVRPPVAPVPANATSTRPRHVASALNASRRSPTTGQTARSLLLNLEP